MTLGPVERLCDGPELSSSELDDMMTFHTWTIVLPVLMHILVIKYLQLKRIYSFTFARIIVRAPLSKRFVLSSICLIFFFYDHDIKWLVECRRFLKIDYGRLCHFHQTHPTAHRHLTQRHYDKRPEIVLNREMDESKYVEVKSTKHTSSLAGGSDLWHRFTRLRVSRFRRRQSFSSQQLLLENMQKLRLFPIVNCFDHSIQFQDAAWSRSGLLRHKPNRCSIAQFQLAYRRLKRIDLWQFWNEKYRL